MRPGRMPRKYPGYRIEWFPKLHRSFNEAGADAPEIPSAGLDHTAWAARFNEAGADAPEIPGATWAAIKTKTMLQ